MSEEHDDTSGGEDEATARPTYQHDAEHGETRYPPNADADGVERDPHAPLNRPVDASAPEEDELEAGA